ncbi:hypothetical protein EAG_04944 [Camponotus floridanus]|uniref:Uncharacterized protein n=1 Tax=Camponotus floridanus TaxID=104421 RepID=E2AMD8_CAMFO|nr:hypothetical protein EAG_04944 [Camponotus floridanus]
MDTKIPDRPFFDLHPTSKRPHAVFGVNSTVTAQASDDKVHYLQRLLLHTCRELWTIPEGAIATTANYFSHDRSKYISFGVVAQMPRSRRRHRSRSHSRTRSHSVGSPQYEHKRRRIDYESPQSKGTYSGERVLRSRQHERGTSQERRYKRSHRRSPSSGRQHGHRDRDRDRPHLAHPTSSRRTRVHRHHGSSSVSPERHRHRSPSTRSQTTTNQELSLLMPCGSVSWWPRHDWDAWLQRNVIETTREFDVKLDVTPETNDSSASEVAPTLKTFVWFHDLR